ncbi:FlaA1/EpsC-like NDP-sugar epimerase [Marinobacterium halophilum]|uniref:FlaA1/EpsC-like NDP-sugar epimerase n=1 Tax=Marinobacterium halophilum TaxID=267374 RepID=A0A2P8ETY3_9GAMM|nr:nucleoside-diphosphate sugar epimerase/dehydratase [Marinobacterium halophilum]PSL12931.1 FlaA1/EpsC-like NDP-sugar epimerase [Marinobacterium halophilum]
MDSSGVSLRSLHYRILALGRNYKKALMVLADFIALPVALWSSYALRLSQWWPTDYMAEVWWLFLATPAVGLVVFMKLGLYRAVVRFMGAQAILAVFKGVVILAVLMWASAFFFNVEKFPRSVPIIFALAALVYVGGSRLLVRNYYHWLIGHYVHKEPVLIYGAGGAGVQLSTALLGGGEYVPVGFVDDDPTLWKTTVSGMRVYNPQKLAQVIESEGVTHVLLALPSATRSDRRRILEQLAEHSVYVKTIPSMSELVSGESLEALRDVDPEDLLGREPVPPIESLVASSIKDKVVMVSGAGGSIGSEICRQVLRNGPRALVLYEMSEFSLYSIEQELAKAAVAEKLDVPLYAMLGSVLDAARVRRILDRFGVQTIYHAAAYKHVPMVEHNVFEGIRNNALGTQVMAEEALAAGVERFVLISTDKAVRPTNVMGATKRLAELIIQGLAQRSGASPCAPHETVCKTIFSMVRFGNVLGSSGSVVPLFRRQIEAGGPVTVTHPDITRFFMTIPEAASLVIQSGSMAKGGDVFVLDMGEPVKIVDLARRMIQLMGYEVKSEQHPDGDIAVEYTGLRPGEKLYEELLIGADVIGTEHPKIMRAHEESLPAELLQELLDQLQTAMEQADSHAGRELLQRAVRGFVPSSPNVDLLLKTAPQTGAIMH